jgi:hypothetical protein
MSRRVQGSKRIHKVTQEVSLLLNGGSPQLMQISIDEFVALEDSNSSDESGRKPIEDQQQEMKEMMGGRSFLASRFHIIG